MSLIAHILFERQTTLPTGKRIRHTMEDSTRRRPDAQPKPGHRNQAMKARNIEAVYAAVAAGCQTHAEIDEMTKLSQATTKKALYALEDWADGPRIVRDRSGARHRFSVCDAQESTEE